MRYRNKYGRERSYYTGFEGVVQWIERRHSDTESDWSRDRYEGYMRDVPCPACAGARLKPEILAVTIAGRNIADICAMSVGECHDFIDALVLNDRQRMIAERVLKEINARLRFLVDVGLDYLSLDRPAGTLSGGEAQRIRLATQIGSGLVGVLYVLDEPSIGLHQRDNHRLIETLLRLKRLGNTLIVVEHDEDTIRTADWVVDIGPGAGEHGGRIVHTGSLKDLLKNQESITGRVPVRAADDPAADAAPTADVGPGADRPRGARAQPAQPDRAASRSASSSRSPGCPARASPRSSTTSSTRCWPTRSTAPGWCRAGTPASAGSTRSTRWSGSTSHRSGARHGRTRPRTPGSSTTSGGCSRRPPRRRSAGTGRGGSRSTSRAVGARTAPATAPSRSR